MTSLITISAANEHRNDLLRAARRRNLVSVAPEAEPGATSVSLRQTQAEGNAEVGRLAELDGARPLEGGVLVAVVNGEAVAALSLDDGRVVANPFRFTTGPVSLLRLRAEQLSAPRPQRRLAARLRLRAA